jgi:hypothetical protein
MAAATGLGFDCAVDAHRAEEQEAERARQWNPDALAEPEFLSFPQQEARPQHRTSETTRECSGR